MYEIKIEKVFHASHALKLYDGTMEEVHAHDWVTYVVVSSEDLDGMEVVMDFHALEEIVDEVLRPLAGSDLNEVELLAGYNPSAERVAECIYKAIEPSLPARVKLESVTVTEAVGCMASYKG